MLILSYTIFSKTFLLNVWSPSTSQASPNSFLEMQSLSLTPNFLKQSLYLTDPQVIPMHTKVWEAML